MINFNLGDYIHSHKGSQFVRFVFVGCSSFLISFTIYYVIYKFCKISNVLLVNESNLAHSISSVLDMAGIKSVDGAFANICGYSAGVVNSFTWNKIWTFRAKHQTTKQFKRFIFVNALSLTLSTLGIFIFVDQLGKPFALIWFIFGVFTTMLNYYGYKLWVFPVEGHVEK